MALTPPDAYIGVGDRACGDEVPRYRIVGGEVARVLIFDTRPMNRSTSASMISVVRDHASAATRDKRTGGRFAAKSEGCEAIARHEATSRSEYPPNSGRSGADLVPTCPRVREQVTYS
ncbi:hypothetical protein HNR61_004786 [Actinomadura namibiensis]|uniref:Uncharacterized protein n=1 Tax=Actinomadura namibiensis TaxID=182080 RepID=A0A7W3LRS7_ACTNM|nr:hypothetical protein [Actinomadura namibiensis]MBA8953136.1 hypothetical protein [Actinomadura namibiensis]